MFVHHPSRHQQAGAPRPPAYRARATTSRQFCLIPQTLRGLRFFPSQWSLASARKQPILFDLARVRQFLAYRDRLRDLAVYFFYGYTGSQQAIRRTADGRRPAIEDVLVDHRGGHVLVPHQLLHGPDIIPVFFEEMRGKRPVEIVVVLSREGWKRSKSLGGWGPPGGMGLAMRLSVSTATSYAGPWGHRNHHRSSYGAIDTQHPYGCHLMFREPRRHSLSRSWSVAS